MSSKFAVGEVEVVAKHASRKNSKTDTGLPRKQSCDMSFLALNLIEDENTSKIVPERSGEWLIRFLERWKLSRASFRFL